MVKRKKRKKNKLFFRRIIMFLVLIVIVVLIFRMINEKKQENESIQAFSSIDKIIQIIEKSSYANITRYIVYGTHLNLEGNIEIKEDYDTIKNIEVIAKDVVGEEVVINSDYTYENGLISFSTLKEINNGLNLESLNETEYYILLKVEFLDNKTKYYSVSNDTEYGDIEYYTLTRNNTNNKINISFSESENIPVLGLNITTVNELPEDVYDIVIDPGHGGNDGGATSDEYIESEIVLECANELKKQLENIGLKVLLTRDGTESPEEYNTYNIYDDDGRVTVANESGAKILISLHMNSNSSDISDGGVEVYASPNSDLALAKLFADNIVKTADTEYSQMEAYKKADGVYVRTIDIKNYREEDSNNSFFRTYKGIFDSIPYFFIIREIGGITTGAYVDGRNSDYEANKYRNSNVGLEGYLIELGYMNVEEDLYNVLRKENLYMKAITDSINEFYKIENY